MSRADETAAQQTETPDKAQSTDCTTPLPRRFLATASGPVTRITDHSDETTERVRADISIEYSIETLEEFRDEGTFRSYGVSPFCINGTIFADRTPQPELWELKKAHQPVGIDPVDPAAGVVEIHNRFHFTPLSALETTWELTDGETVLQDGVLSLEVEPGATREVTVSFDDPDLEPGAEYWLTVSVALAEDTRWADAGHEVAFEQLAVPFDVPQPPLEAIDSMPSTSVSR